MNIICKIIGHQPRYTRLDRGIAGPWTCQRCEHIDPGITWPKPPPMPPVVLPPDCNLRDFYDAAHELLPDSKTKAIVEYAMNMRPNRGNKG